MEQIVNKVMLGKSKFLISIKYTEGEDSKLLESNEFFDRRFRENLERLRMHLDAYLGFDGKDKAVIVVDSVTFANTEKQPIKLTFHAKLNAQTAGIGISLARGDAYMKVTEDDAEDVLAFVYKDINELQEGCLRYLNGERAQQNFEM
jgi:hypothetical protein